MSVLGSSTLQVNYRHLLKTRNTSQILNELLAQEYAEQEFEEYVIGFGVVDGKRLFDEGSDTSGETVKSGVQDVELQKISARFDYVNRQDYLCASLDGKAVCVESERVISIIRAPESLRGSDGLIVPHAMYVNWEGRGAPVLNLTKMTRLPQPSLAESIRILIMKGSEAVPTVGLLVSSISNIVTINAEAFSPLASGYQDEVGCCKAVCSLGGEPSCYYSLGH